MRPALALVVVCACHHVAPTTGDDAGVPPRGDAMVAIDASADADVDAGVDAPPGPAALVAVSTPSWLHEHARLVFDRALASADVTATVTLGGATLAATADVDATDPRAVVIAIDPAARGTGALAIHVEGDVVADDGGATAHVATDIATTLAAWSAPSTSVAAAAAPTLAVTAGGEIVAAWRTTTSRTVVARLAGGRWQPLGGSLGTTDVSSVALVLDAAGAVLVAWCESNTVHVARWVNGAWQELASPGNGSAVVLASAGAGAQPVVAVFGSAVQVRQLDATDAWQAICVDVPALFAGEPLLAVSTSAVAVGWLDRSSALHVARAASGAWSELPPIAGATTASLAARGDVVAIAWATTAGSSTVLAAQADAAATTWTALGHALDAGPGDDAVGPAIALDTTLHPIVAWSEGLAGRARGVIARWQGHAWALVAGATWQPADATALVRASLALGPGDAPVVGGGATVAAFDGPVAPAATRVGLGGCAFAAGSPPAQLSQTGCFTIASAPVPAAGLVPYDVVVELWSDGAKKRRWLGLPAGATMARAANGSWSAPAGTFVIKEFALETTPGDPTTRRPVETRFLVVDAGGWHGFSYRWRLDGSDADLQPDAEATASWPMDDGSTHDHFYPSRTDCVQCHQSSNGPLLGLRPTQLARWFDYGGVLADQPTMLAALRVTPATSSAPLASPHDPSWSYELRTRGYMAGNCAHCHNPDDVAIHDLRWETPLPDSNLCPDIVPGDPAGSRVYQLVSSRPGMPPLGTLAVDPIAVDILGRWISGMTSCP